MTAPNVIWAWPWEVNPSMGQWETKPSIVGENTRYICADAPELLALVALVRDCIETNSEFQTQWDKDATSALAAWESITASKEATK